MLRLFMYMLLLTSSTLLCGQTFRKIDYLDHDLDKKARHVIGKLTFDSPNKTMRFDGRREQLHVNLSHKTPELLTIELKSTEISEAVYERTKTPRYAEALFIAWPLIFTHEKQHYFTIQYKTVDGTGRYALFHLDKKNYREILAAFQASMGIKPERVEEH
jgi:hypothetical protein